MSNKMINLVTQLNALTGHLVKIFRSSVIIIVPIFLLSLAFNFTNNEHVYCPAKNVNKLVNDDVSKLCKNEKKNILVNTRDAKGNQLEQEEIINNGDGLFLYGPKIYLAEGRYRIKYEWTVKDVSKDNPTATLHFFKNSPSGVKTLLYDTYHLTKTTTGKEIIFDTVGGSGHEFAVYVNGSSTIIDFDYLVVEPVDVLWYSGFEVYMPFFYVAIFVLLLWLTLTRIEHRISPKTGAVILTFSLLSIYSTLIIQDDFSLKEIALSGDSPNYIVYADYIHKYSKTDILDRDVVYDSTRYLDLTNQEITDSATHLHQEDGNFFFQHQVAYPWLIAKSFEFLGRSIESALIISVISIFLGVLFIYLILLKYREPHTALFSSIAVGLSAPLIFYSFTIYTETIAFFIVTAMFYALFYSTSKYVRIINCAAGNLLLFFKFKFFAIIYPLLAFYALLKWKKSKLFIFLLSGITILFLVGFFIHTYSHTGSFHPLSWYGAKNVANTVDIYSQVIGTLALFSGLLLDQRFGLLLFAPHFFLFGFYFRSYFHHIKNDSVLLAGLISAVGYLLFYSASGSWGGESPVLRPYMPVIGILSIILLSNKKVEWRHILIAMSISIGTSVSMLVSGYFQASYSTNYSHYFEMIMPSSLTSELLLPNIYNNNSYMNYRKKRQGKYKENVEPIFGKVKIDADDIRLKTSVGYKQSGSIYSSKKTGYIVYGPYMHLPSGKYTVELFGDYTKESGKVVFDINSLDNILLSSNKLSNFKNKLFEEVIVVNKDVTAVEFRLWVDSKAIVRFDHLVLTPLNN